jgi:hypothetical protein
MPLLCRDLSYLYLLPMASLLPGELSGTQAGLLAGSCQPSSAQLPHHSAIAPPPWAPASTESGVKPQARAAASAIKGEGAAVESHSSDH